MKTYKAKLYSSKKTKYLDQLLNVACDVYNFALSHKKSLYDNDKISISKNDLQKLLSQLRNSDGYKPWKELGSQVVQQITDRIYNGYNLFFANIKKHVKKTRPPKFKKYYKYKSITFKQAGYKLLSGNQIKIGNKIFKFHKSQKIKGVIKTLTIKRNKLGEYFLFIITDHVEKAKNTAKTGKSVGFDFGLKQFLTGSDNNNIFSPLFFKQNKRKLAQLNRKLSFKKKGSRNKKKARIKLARLHEKIANQRNNFHWQLANKLVKKYDQIFLEDLNLQEMKKRFGRKVSDLGFAEFVKILEYVSIKHNKIITKIGKWYPSSKTCSKCGNINNELKLRDREWSCNSCNEMHDRDYNAARNILAEGLQIVGTSTIKVDIINPELISGNIKDFRIPRL